jgi:hypothetical protein
VVERIDGLPSGVIGYRATGKLTKDEYEALMVPIYALLDEGGPVNLLFVIDDGFSGLELGAFWDDVKAGASVGLKHRSAWRRMAVVTDKDWIRNGAAAFAWLSPGELRVFDMGDEAEATAWLAEP